MESENCRGRRRTVVCVVMLESGSRRGRIRVHISEKYLKSYDMYESSLSIASLEGFDPLTGRGEVIYCPCMGATLPSLPCALEMLPLAVKANANVGLASALIDWPNLAMSFDAPEIPGAYACARSHGG